MIGLEDRQTLAQDIEAAHLRISANVTGDFGNVTDFDRMLGCAKRIVGMGSV
jgi:hypothetical protein